MKKCFLFASLTFLFTLTLCITSCHPIVELPEKPCIVTFDLRGGIIDNDYSRIRIAVVKSNTIEELPVPKKGNSTFGGWFTEKEGLGDEFTNKTQVDSDIMVFAKWITYE